MSLIVKMRKQKAVYWGTPTPDGFGGSAFAAPVELDVRWEGKAELFLDSQGQETVSKAVVYTGQDVDIDGYLWLGKLTDLPTGASPLLLSGAVRIKQVTKTPNLKVSEYLRTVYT